MIDFSKAEIFLDEIFLQLLRNEIDVSYYELDHMCYRVESLVEYEENKLQLSELGELLSENEVGGRTIAVYKLLRPIIYQNRKIFIVELPAPKEGSDYKTGFEHVEFVVDGKLKEFIEQYPEIEFNKKGIAKKINPDLSINFGDISVKFHRDTLENVIELEQS